MKKLFFYTLYLFVLSISIFSFTSSENNKKENISIITRSIDVSKTFREFPDLTEYWNTSLQKAPAPIIGKIAEDSFGKAKITRCWLNLDEMWDYRTREFNFNFQIGVDKYKAINEKYRESWDWEVETNIHYYDYLKTFSTHSEEILLNIRRYERDIMDKKIPVSSEDYKMLIKTGLKHYKKLFPNIKYVQICNEYNGGFMWASDEEYYKFYKIGYEAINDVNSDLKLKGNDRILVGMAPPAGYAEAKLGSLLALYKNDLSTTKKMDFVSWHDYDRLIQTTANREEYVKSLLRENGLSENLPLFITEHEPYHGSYDDNQKEHHMLNVSHLPKSLYFASLNSPNLKIFPWVLYHNLKIQTKFMFFSGPNETETTEDELKMLPLGCSFKLLSMLKGKEIKVENSIESEDLVIAVCKDETIVVEVINYSDRRNVKINIDKLGEISSKFKKGKLHLEKFLIDSNHSNCLTNPDYLGGIEKVEDFWIDSNGGEIKLIHEGLEKNGIIQWHVVNQ